MCGKYVGVDENKIDVYCKYCGAWYYIKESLYKQGLMCENCGEYVGVDENKIDGAKSRKIYD